MRISPILFLLLSFCLVTATGCKKKDKISPDYTANMGGVRYWRGTETIPNFPGGALSTFSMTDTFALIIGSSTAIAVPTYGRSIYSLLSFHGNPTLQYSSTDAAAHTYTFIFSEVFGHGTHGIVVTYNYVDSSMSLQVISNSASSGEGSLVEYTP